MRILKAGHSRWVRVKFATVWKCTTTHMLLDWQSQPPPLFNLAGRLLAKSRTKIRSTQNNGSKWFQITPNLENYDVKLFSTVWQIRAFGENKTRRKLVIPVVTLPLFQEFQLKNFIHTNKNKCFVTKFWKSTEERWVAPGAKLKHPRPQWHEHVSFLTKCSHSSVAVLSVEVANESPQINLHPVGILIFQCQPYLYV